MFKRTLILLVVAAAVSAATGCLFRNHGRCERDYDSSARYDYCR